MRITLWDSRLAFEHLVAALSLHPQVHDFVALADSGFPGGVGDRAPPALHAAEGVEHGADVLDEDATLCPSSSRPELEDDIVCVVIGSRRYQQFPNSVRGCQSSSSWMALASSWRICRFLLVSGFGQQFLQVSDVSAGGL